MACMAAKMLGNPLLAWRDDTTLQVGWGTHCVVVEDAPGRLPDWLRLLNGARSDEELMAIAEQWGIQAVEARSLLAELSAAGLITAHSPTTVSVHPCGLLQDPLTRALRDAGVTVERGADVIVYPQGQVPTLVNAPPMARRLVPLWMTARAVHVGPVLDRDSGPCPMCIDAEWTASDPLWPELVAQSVSVATWSLPSQIAQAAAVVALIADHPGTIGLEMILDADHPGPRWRVWSVSRRCRCQLEHDQAG